MALTLATALHRRVSGVVVCVMCIGRDGKLRGRNTVGGNPAAAAAGLRDRDDSGNRRAAEVGGAQH